MVDKSSSDEKLLKLIEGTSELKRMPKVGVKLRPKVKGLALPFKLDFSFKPSLENINRILFVISGLLTLFFVYNLLSGSKALNASAIFPSAGESSAIAKLIAQGEGGFLPIKDYLGEINKRNIFLAPGENPVAQQQADQPPAIAAVSESIKNLKLVGVIWSSNPEVMIEDMKENRTYLLKKSDVFGQLQIKVKNINLNSAILEVSVGDVTKEYELR
jgi:hypothetical protein